MNGWKLCYPPIIHLFAKQNSKGANSMKGKKKILVSSILKTGQSRKYSFFEDKVSSQIIFLKSAKNQSIWLAESPNKIYQFFHCHIRNCHDLRFTFLFYYKKVFYLWNMDSVFKFLAVLALIGVGIPLSALVIVCSSCPMYCSPSRGYYRENT